jgi:CRISPR type III-B/RAMP module-associated protein Cmr5
MSGRPNLDQIRARNAIAAIRAGTSGRGVEDGDAISGFPALVVNNGLLATLSFCISKKESGGYRQIGDAIARHLADEGVKLAGKDTQTLVALRDFLVTRDSTTLRLCTAETLAYLNHLKRFAKGETKRRDEE